MTSQKTSFGTDRFLMVTMAIFSLIQIAPTVQAAQSEEEADPLANAMESAAAEPHMPESLRSAVSKMVVIAGQSPANRSVVGSFEKDTAGLIDGMGQGSRIGTISREVGGVPVNIPIPVLGTLGAIYGGISGATKREIQEFRDALTEELISADSPPLRSDGLALDAFWSIRKLPKVESHLFAPNVEIENDTDAILYVDLNDLTIDVQGKEAVITATAVATLRRLSDGFNVYETNIQYQDRDTLKNWTRTDNALWRDFVNFARHYLGREVAADTFNRVYLNHELTPLETDTVERARKDKGKFTSESTTPTLAWDLKLNGGDAGIAWSEQIDESAVFYEVDIFDQRQLVYSEPGIPDPQHTLAFDLEACKTYRWTVRPVYHFDGNIRYGEWMRFDNDDEETVVKGLRGRKASVAPAYTQDFARLEIECPKR